MVAREAGASAVRLWMILILALLVAAVYWPSTAVFAGQWSDWVNLTYTHGWLVFGLCVALVIRSRREISAPAARPSRGALLALAGCVFLWLVCYRASIQDAHITILPAIFWLAATGALGWSVGRWLLFPVAFFYFAVPSWSQLAEPLQDLTVLAMRFLLALTGPQVVISGDLVHIPNGTFEIQEGCSGLHFMIVGLAVAALHGELRRDSFRTRLAQLAFMAALALIANWVRVYTVIEVGYLTDMRSSLLRNHYWFGWGVFAVALAAFFLIRARFEPAIPAAPAPELAAQPGAFRAAPPEDSHAPVPAARPGASRASTSEEWFGPVIAAVILVGLPGASYALRATRPAPPLPAVVSADPRVPWAPTLVDIHSTWQPHYPGAAREQRLAFADTQGDSVEVFAVTYRAQRQGAKIFGLGTSLEGRLLALRPDEVVESPGGRFRENEVAERVRPYGLYLIWSRYESAGRDFVSPLTSQLWYGLNATVSNPTASLVAFRAACRPDCAAAHRVLGAFAAAQPR